MDQLKIEEVKAPVIKPFSIARYIENHNTLITLLIAVMGLLAPAGYIAGIIYHQTYLNEFGIDSGLFPITAQESYFYAYIVATVYISKAIQQLLSLNTLYIVTSLLAGYTILAFIGAKIARWKIATDETETKFSRTINNLIQWFHPINNDFTVAMIVIYEAFYWAFKTGYIILILAVCWLLLFMGAYNSAQEAAQTKLDSNLEGDCRYEDSKLYSCTKILSSDGTVIAMGYLVTSSKAKVALFSAAGTSIRFLQPTDRLLRPRQEASTDAVDI